MKDRINHDEVVARIYDLADAPGRWREIIGCIASGLAAEKGHVFLAQGSQTLMSEVAGYDNPAPTQIAYYEHFIRVDPRIALSLAHPNRVLCDADGDYDWSETSVYNELLKAEDIRHSMYVQLEVEPNLVAGQAFMRPHGGVAFDAEDVRAFQRLQPHLARAIKMGRTLDAMRAELVDLRRALELLPIPVLILDGKGVVLCMSGRAEGLLGQQRRLALVKQRLTAMLPRDAKALEAAIATTAQYAEPLHLRATTLPTLPRPLEVQVDEARSFRLSFMPLRPRLDLRQRVDGRARVLVVLHASDEQVKLSPELIAQLHGLTPTEALLAAALAEGRTVTQYAAERGCSEQTARVHLKHILEKTGTHRQAELVGLLMGSAALHLVSG